MRTVPSGSGRAGGRVRPVGRRLIFLLLAAALLLGPGPVRAGENASRGEVRVGKANVRKAPDKHSRRLFSLRRHARVRIVRESGDWLRIIDDRGRRGWLFSTLVKRLPPPRIKPEITLFCGSPSPARKKVLARLVEGLRQELAGPEKRRLALEITFLSEAAGADRVKSSPSQLKTPAPGTWLLALKVPFSRSAYRKQLGRKSETGVVDLLPFQPFLGALLNCRDRFLAAIEKDPALWSGEAAGRPLVECLVILESAAGDQVALSGRREHGLPVFSDHLLVNVHGFSQFSLPARIPASVSDFNLFVLPPAFLADGSRSPAALAYDFFGLAY